MPSYKKHRRPINSRKTLESYSELPSKALENAAKESSKALIPLSTNNPLDLQGNLQLAAPSEAINPTRYFCTIASKVYFLKALALYFSLLRNCKSFHLWICAVDDITYYTILSMHLKNITILPLSKLEDKELLAVKSSRKLNEYCWTLKAPLIQYILNNYRVEAIIYCDGDLFFFSDPEPIFSEWD